MGEAVKKILFFIVCALSFLNANSALPTDEKIDELKRRVCGALPLLEGWCTTEKAVNFIDLVLEVEPDVCVEIGVFGGRSLFPVAYTLKFLDHGVIYAIDPWDKFECLKYFDPVENQFDIIWWGKLNLNYIYGSYFAMLRKYDLEKHCITLKMTSERAASEIDTIDILHIDGNHSEETSLSDVRLYLPKVRSGGYIWMNDSSWPDRQEAIDLLIQSCDFVKLIDGCNCILFKKR
jgi:hypothetical protein